MLEIMRGLNREGNVAQDFAKLRIDLAAEPQDALLNLAEDQMPELSDEFIIPEAVEFKGGKVGFERKETSVLISRKELGNTIICEIAQAESMMPGERVQVMLLTQG
jgi:hypothetical protein